MKKYLALSMVALLVLAACKPAPKTETATSGVKAPESIEEAESQLSSVGNEEMDKIRDIWMQAVESDDWGTLASKASELLSNYEPSSPAWDSLMSLKFTSLLFNGDIEGAKALAKEIEKAKPEGVLAQALKGEEDPYDKFGILATKAAAYFMAGKYDKAEAIVDQLLAASETPAEIKQNAYSFKARLTLQKGDEQGAMALLEEAVKLDPESEIAKQIKVMQERMHGISQEIKEDVEETAEELKDQVPEKVMDKIRE